MGNSTWLPMRLGDVCSKIGSGATPRGGAASYLDQGPYALVRSQNIYNHGFERDGLAFIDEDQAKALQSVELYEDDVLLNITGESVGRSCQVPMSILPARVNQHVAIVRADPTVLDPLYLRYALISPHTQQELAGLSAAGATRRALTKAMIESLVIRAPQSLETQRRIANTLGALDDKIELNRRMSETLEQILHGVYSAWFVERSYVPDHFRHEWATAPTVTSPLGELFEVRIGRTPPRKERWHFLPGGEGVPWLSIRTMGDGNLFAHDSDESLTDEAVTQFRVPVAPAGTVLVSFKLTVGRVVIAARDMATNEAIAHLVRRPDTPVGTAYTYCFMKAVDYDSLGSTSSIATAVNSATIRSIPMPLPPRQLHDAFDELARPILDRIRVQQQESRTLTSLRDVLLPKLISGELRVPEAEQLVSEVA